MMKLPPGKFFIGLLLLIEVFIVLKFLCSVLSSSGSLERNNDCNTLRETIARYFGAEGRVECGERFRVCGKRVMRASDGTERHEYLIEWEGYTAGDLDYLRKT